LFQLWGYKANNLFLNQKEVVQKEDVPSISTKIQRNLLTDELLFSKKRKDTYAYTFANHTSFDTILLNIETLYKQSR
jgi:hypothetical protein